MRNDNPLPCRHIWEFKHVEDQYGIDAYFECKNCHKQEPYEPEELADMEQEMNNYE